MYSNGYKDRFVENLDECRVYSYKIYNLLEELVGGGNDFSGERIAGSIGINTNASLKYTTNT